MRVNMENLINYQMEITMRRNSLNFNDQLMITIMQ